MKRKIGFQPGLAKILAFGNGIVFSRRLSKAHGFINKKIFGENTGKPDIKSVLIYSPNIGGHRHLYCKKIIDFLLKKNVHVFLAYRGILTSQKKKTYSEYNSTYLDCLNGNELFHTIKITDESDSVCELTYIAGLQKENNIDLTIFPDGDCLKWTLARQLLPWHRKLQGKKYAMFIKSEFMYKGAIPQEERILDAFFHFSLFNNYRILDAAFYSDENIINHAKNNKFIHLPEITSPRLEVDSAEEREQFYIATEERYHRFLDMHQGKDVILCFGDLEIRKGYDYLLRLVSEHEDLVLVRVGRTKPGFRFTDWDSVFHKEKILRAGRLFEVDTYISDQRFIDILYDSTRYILLPYKRFYRTSGAMIQASLYNKPVLVPHTGLLKYRVRTYKIGKDYIHNNYSSFEKIFLELKTDCESYSNDIACYVEEFFDGTYFEKSLEKIF